MNYKKALSILGIVALTTASSVGGIFLYNAITASSKKDATPSSNNVVPKVNTEVDGK
jgi:hypothetical protein